MKVCTVCVLPDTFPGVDFNDQGMCRYCGGFRGLKHIEQQRRAYRERFERLLQDRSQGRIGGYDVLVAYSGGKDSTFTLDLLKTYYGLRILAVTFDHGFISPHASENIIRVIEALGIDHMTYRPNPQTMNEVIRYSIEHEFHPSKALRRASSICNSCMGLVKFVILNIALEKKIPFVAYGWSPGQAPIQSALLRNDASFLNKMQKLFLHPLEKALGQGVRSYFVDESVLRRKDFPVFLYNVNPLAFSNYDEEIIYERIAELGWKFPADTDANSTNCLLNGFANEVHLRKHGYHPQVMELAELVREGILTRDEALSRLARPSEASTVATVKLRLGLA
jgi:tRNA(Ile)-lysidine synthase TilS/MesJ